MSSTYLQIDSVRKRFGANEVLKGVSAQVRKGECLVLLGPSGCGKTTLLNLLAGGLTADAGSLACDGTVLDDPEAGIHVPMRKRNFAMVFQEFSLWPHMTVAENIAFGLKLRGNHGSESRAKVEKVLEQVHMQDFAKRWPGELSGGQQQRVAIARALVVRPRVLLLDEPLSALDARLRESLKEEIATLLREESITAVYVTHDQAEAFAIGHQIALMNAGSIEQIGTPEDLYLRPQTQFVASFMGAANVFACAVSGSMLSLESVLPVCPASAVGTQVGSHCMVRREAVEVVPAMPLSAESAQTQVQADGTFVCQGVARRVRFLGDRHEVFVSVAPKLEIRGYAREAIGEAVPVQVRFPIAELRFFEG